MSGVHSAPEPEVIFVMAQDEACDTHKKEGDV
jgi:hypothetical protein